MERKKYSAEFKREAVRLAGQGGVSRAKVAQELGLNVTMLARWVREAQADKWDMAPSGAATPPCSQSCRQSN